MGKYLKQGFVRALEWQHAREEISHSKMVELMEEECIKNYKKEMEDNNQNDKLYLLYGGSSEDGLGSGEYIGRTTDEGVAFSHFVSIIKDGYSTGTVRIVTATKIDDAYFYEDWFSRAKKEIETFSPKKEMTQKEMIQIALIAVDRNYDYKRLKSSYFISGREEFMDEVWNYVDECKNIGLIAWREKYNL